MSSATPDPASAADLIARFQLWAGWSGHALTLDTETTGLDGEIIELAIVRVYDEQVLFNERFRPVHPVTPGAQDVHGITTEELQDCPTIWDRWPAIRYALLGGLAGNILIYNRQFDLRALNTGLTAACPNWYANTDPATNSARTGDTYSADHYVLDLIHDRAECVMEAFAPLAGQYSEWHGDYRWARLADACALMGVDTSDLKTHSALGDAMATARLIKAVAAADPARYPWIGQEGVTP